MYVMWLRASNGTRGDCWTECGIMMMLEILRDTSYTDSPSLKPWIVSIQPFTSPPKVSLARQVQASEMGGQHEAGGVDPESTSVPVQRAFYRGLLWYSMGHPLPEEHSHPNHFPLHWGCMYLSWVFFHLNIQVEQYVHLQKITVLSSSRAFGMQQACSSFCILLLCLWLASNPIWLILLCSACTLPPLCKPIQ